MTIGQPIIEHSLKHRIHLHQHPELSFQEYATNDHIKKQLKAWDIPYVTARQVLLLNPFLCLNF